MSRVHKSQAPSCLGSWISYGDTYAAHVISSFCSLDFWGDFWVFADLWISVISVIFSKAAYFKLWFILCLWVMWTWDYFNDVCLLWFLYLLVKFVLMFRRHILCVSSKWNHLNGIPLSHPADAYSMFFLHVGADLLLSVTIRRMTIIWTMTPMKTSKPTLSSFFYAGSGTL
jgi:hypothetical protein